MGALPENASRAERERFSAEMKTFLIEERGFRPKRKPVPNLPTSTNFTS